MTAPPPRPRVLSPHGDSQDGLPIGWAPDGAERSHRPAGFLGSAQPCRSAGPWDYTGTGHLITIGPTGSGKTRSSAVPALLTHWGSAVVVDIKGELAAITADRRRAMGQRVFTIDPWGLLGPDTDSLNPTDLLRLDPMAADDAAIALATLMLKPMPGQRGEAYWTETATALLAGLVAQTGQPGSKVPGVLSHLRELFADDLDEWVSACLNGSTGKSRLAAEEFGIYLQIPEEKTRPSVRATAQTSVRVFATQPLKRAMDRSVVDLQALRDGEPTTIYLVFPPEKLTSHRAALCIWIGTVLHTLSMREHEVYPPTLLLIDEAAQLGRMPELKEAITLLRGYGVQTWTFWQDLSQIKRCHGADWETVLNNAAVIQLLQPNNRRMAEGYAEIAGGLHASEILTMPLSHQVLVLDSHRGGVIAPRVDYLSDARFAGLYQPNPRFRATTSP